MASNRSKSVPLILDVFYLLQTNDFDRRYQQRKPRYDPMSYAYCRICEVSSAQTPFVRPFGSLPKKPAIHGRRCLSEGQPMYDMSNPKIVPVPMVLSNSKSPTRNCLEASPNSLLRGCSAISPGERGGPLHS